MGKPFASLEKAIEILSLFEPEHQGLSAHEISKRLGIPLSTTYKYLDIFIRKEFLSKDMYSKKIFLGRKIFKLGNRAAERFSIVGVAFPYMNSLSQQSREAVILTVIYGMEALCVESIESPRMVSLSVKKGATLPLHAGSSQKILLAYQDESFIDTLIESRGLVKLNENTITDPQQLKRELELIREQGFAQSDSEVDSGAGAVAAPIFDHDERLAAGLTIVGPTDRILFENRDKLIGMVTDIAQRISSEIVFLMGIDGQPGGIDG